MKNTKDPGTVSEMKVAAALLQKGKTVLTPIGNSERYDLVFTNPWSRNHFERVQCKTGRINRFGNVKFDNRSCSNGKHSTYENQVDYFGVYYPANGKCYLVPITHCGRNSTTLTLESKPNSRGLPSKQYEI